MKEDKPKFDFDIVGKIVSLLQDLDVVDQVHILKTVNIWLKIDGRSKSSPETTKRTGFWDSAPREVERTKKLKFSGRKDLSPKQFMLEKQPRTDVERLACLAYYLTHYRDTPQFKTIDLSKLNTEAAQRKFSNATVTAKNAARIRYFVPASKKGHRQLSADGEQIIAALPDREVSAAIRKRMSRRRTTKRSSRRKTKSASK